MSAKDSVALLSYYDGCLNAMGDTARGAGWPNEPDRLKRFDVMLDLISNPHLPARICDLGCGTGELYRRITDKGFTMLDYIGIDASAKAIAYARRKFPDVPFLVKDVRSSNQTDRSVLASDYVVANGLFTVKASLSDDEMWIFLTSTIDAIWPFLTRGLAFNVMSAMVDWKRDDLFHVEMDRLAAYLFRLAGRRVQFRADYGLFEYTAYVYKTE